MLGLGPTGIIMLWFGSKGIVHVRVGTCRGSTCWGLNLQGWYMLGLGSKGIVLVGVGNYSGSTIC